MNRTDRENTDILESNTEANTDGTSDTANTSDTNNTSDTKDMYPESTPTLEWVEKRGERIDSIIEGAEIEGVGLKQYLRDRETKHNYKDDWYDEYYEIKEAFWKDWPSNPDNQNNQDNQDNQDNRDNQDDQGNNAKNHEDANVTGDSDKTNVDASDVNASVTDVREFSILPNPYEIIKNLINYFHEYIENTNTLSSENILGEDLICVLDVDTSGYAPVGLDIIAIISILFSISVIIIKNPISSVLSLIALFFGVACYLVMMGLTFIGLSYLLLYVGAVSILFLFILMLINVRVSELSTSNNNSIPLVIIVTIIYIYMFSKVLPSDNISISNLLFSHNDIMPKITNLIYYSNFNGVYNIESEIQYVSSHAWDSNISEVSHITSIGSVMYTSYIIWLVITSIILLLAMVGCIVITIKDRTTSS